MDKQEQAPTNTSKSNKAGKIVATVAIGVVVVVVIGIILSPPSPSAKYKAEVIDPSNLAVINPATVSVAFHVTNTGNAPGKPQCTIDAEDPNYTYTGTDIVTMDNELQPGQTTTSADTITITHQGAQYVTQASITCQ